MNDKHFVVQADGDKTRIMTSVYDSNTKRIKFVSQSVADINSYYANQKVQIGEDTNGSPRYQELGKYWLKHPLRRTYEAMYFDPGKCGAGKEIFNQLNLWCGWPIRPEKGDWTLMRRHIEQVLAHDNPKYVDYIIRWAAWTVQNPDKAAEVALVFRGGRGTGKGIFGRTMRNMFGQHGLQIFSPSQVTGKFNAHLLDCCLLFADEAIVPGREGGESQLKGLISEPHLAIEKKGRDIITAPNRLHIILASNESWVIPAGERERRFAVFNVSDKYQQDNSRYFTPLYRQMDEEGGISAMLYDLLEMDLQKWHPRDHIPKTVGLVEQHSDNLLFVSSTALLETIQSKSCITDKVNYMTIYKLLHEKLCALKYRKSGGDNGYLWNLSLLRKAWDKNMFEWGNWTDEPSEYYEVYSSNPVF